MYVCVHLLQVLAGYPHNGQERGEHVLNCMKAVVPILHEDLVDLWDAVIPKLLSYLTGRCLCCYAHHLHQHSLDSPPKHNILCEALGI